VWGAVLVTRSMAATERANGSISLEGTWQWDVVSVVVFGTCQPV
jgi:hypothetical protein